MSVGVMVPLIIFFAMGVAVAYVLWRVMVVGGELRRSAQRERAAADIAHRAVTSLSELCEVVDDLRRRKSGPESGASSLRASTEALRRYAQEAQAVDQKGTEGELGTGLVAEIERAQRAVALVEHGRQLMLDMTIDRVGEGETSIKRGYLNLVHAREAIRARGEQLAREAGSDTGRLARRH
jgi:FtsZ-binding cell division protein ZapB